MNSYSLTHLADGVLLRDLAALVAKGRSTTAALLAHIGEVDARKLYLPAAHPSMFSYCVHVLGLSAPTALKRIRVARTARQFPAIFAAVAAGKLHLSAVILLRPHLTPETADELLAAATHKSKAEIEQLVAQRFPRPDMPTRVEAISPSSPSPPTGQLSPGTLEPSAQRAPGCVGATEPRPKVTPLAPERFALQLTMSQTTHDKLRYAQELLSHSIPSGDIVEVLDRALDVLILRLEKTKFAATDRPRRGRRRSTVGGRYVPAHVKRAVRKRDGNQCTFVSEAGHRCPARTLLEFDHVHPVARGGEATVDGIRQRCRSHNKAGFFPGWRCSDELGQTTGCARHSGKNLLN